MKWLIGIYVLSLGGAVALATCPAPIVVRKPVVVVEKVITPVAVFIPTYFASYVPAPVAPVAPASPPVAPPGTSQPSADTQAILEALRGFDARLRALEGGRVPATPPAAPPVTPPTKPTDPFNPKGELKTPATGKAPTVFTNKCAACHQRGKEADGGNFVLLEADGSVVKLEARKVLSVVRRAYNSTMPPKDNKLGIPPLNDEEVGEVVQFSETQK